MTKLTAAQRRRLLAIADYQGTASFPHIGFWPKSRTDQALERLGLIESLNHTSRFIGAISATFPCCRLTPEGVLTVEEIRPSDGLDDLERHEGDLEDRSR